MRLETGAVEGAGQEARRIDARGGEPVDVAGGEVGARRLKRRDEQLVGLARDHVVAVHEGEVLAGRGVGAGVASAAEPAVLLCDQLEARVARGEALGDRAAAVG